MNGTKQRSDRQKQTLIPWLTGAVIATVSLIFIWFWCDMSYANNDDTLILRTFMGYIGGEIPTFNNIINGVLAYPLHWLGTAFEGIAWFSWMQISFLWLSITVVVKSLMRCFIHREKPMWLGALMGILFVLTFILVHCAMVTFTVTAAILGAAAVLQILNINYEHAKNGEILRGMGLGLLLVVLAYGLRDTAALPILALCGIAFLYCTAEHFGFGKNLRRSIKPMVISLVMVLVVFVSLVGIRQWEINARGMRDHLAWQEARVKVMDYVGLDDLPEELLEEIGWTDAVYNLARRWSFIDKNVNANAFEKIAEYQLTQKVDESFAQKVDENITRLNEFASDYHTTLLSYCLILFIIVICISGLLVQRKGTAWRWLCLLMATLLGLALLAYLCIQGRFAQRAVLTVTMPLAALFFGLLPACVPDSVHVKRVFTTVMMVGGIALCALYLAYDLQSILSKPLKEEDDSMYMNAFQSLDDYALYDPDILFIFDDTLVGDTRMFPDTKMGIPSNVIFWGGWGCRTAEYMHMLANFGIDGENVDASIYLQENVRLARGTLDPEPSATLRYLREEFGEYADYYLESEYEGVYILQFFE